MFLSGISLAHQRGVSEISEGTIRNVYIKKPLVGAQGYVVGDWEGGQVRVEVWNFPSSSSGYEAFIFEIDIPKYVSKMFVGGNKGKDSFLTLPRLAMWSDLSCSGTVSGI